MLVSLWEAPTWLTETTRNICYQFCNESVNLSLEELTQSKDCPQNKLLFLTYMTNSSLGRHMNAVRNSSVLYHKRGPGRGWWWWWWWWWGGGGGSYVARLNFKTSRVGVYKCLSLIVGFAVTVAIWPREVVSCGDFILHAVATFWAMALVGIYPGRTSHNKETLRSENL